MSLYIIIAVLALIIIGFVVLQMLEGRLGQTEASETEAVPSRDLSMYQRKRFLFDTTPEFSVFKILIELFGKDYHVFPQINYSHLVEVVGSKGKSTGYRSRIDRKSADFVLCDKATAVPVLVIELDGSAHRIAKKQGRDSFIGALMKYIGLPILHIKSGTLDKGFIRSEVNKHLPKV